MSCTTWMESAAPELRAVIDEEHAQLKATEPEPKTFGIH
jgi:hypothetical protein